VSAGTFGVEDVDEEDDEDDELDDVSAGGVTGGLRVGANTFLKVKVDPKGLRGGSVGGRTTAAVEDELAEALEPAVFFGVGMLTSEDPLPKKVNHTIAPIAHATTNSAAAAITILPVPDATNDVDLETADGSG
jgi:hypothetical protein